jgi:hypothetical protein
MPQSPLTQWQHAVDEAGLSWRAYGVGFAVSMRMSTQRLECTVLVSTLARRAGMSERSARYGLRELERAGLLHTFDGAKPGPSGGRKASRYVGVVPTQPGTTDRVEVSEPGTADRVGTSQPGTKRSQPGTGGGSTRHHVPPELDLELDPPYGRNLSAGASAGRGAPPPALTAWTDIECPGCRATFAAGAEVQCPYWGNGCVIADESCVGNVAKARAKGGMQ